MWLNSPVSLVTSVALRGAVAAGALAGLLIGCGAPGERAVTGAHPASVHVVFRADGQCTASVGPAAAPPRVTAGAASGGDFECALPGGAGAVDLRVTLPPRVAPAGADFPRLEWHDTPEGWTGTASLPSMPAFVRVPRAGSRAAARARWLDDIALAATALAIVWTLVYSARSRGAGR